ncbi:prepilin-type N-terminal cleavage/methylation domain-containing protein [Candidatus Saccharibacteria bacterium]|nr:prepilin-type N-terminal cleavage/methylation domain-containing protein [Candidatus Saccharibacteria bacterium]
MRRGFTIVEVMMFLAITAALMAGMFIGTGQNIDRNRYDDSVESFRGFLQDQYEIVANPMGLRDGGTLLGVCQPRNAAGGAVNFASNGTINVGAVSYVTTIGNEWNLPGSGNYRGRTNCLIYGRLIEFWDNEITVSSVVGLDLQSMHRITNNVSELTRLAGSTDVAVLREARLGRAGDSYTFVPAWDAQIDGMHAITHDGQRPAQGGILIVRGPATGSVRTFIVSTGNTRADPRALAPEVSGTNIINGIWFLRDEVMADPANSVRFFCVRERAGAMRFGDQHRVVRVRLGIGNSTAVDVLPLNTSEFEGGVVIECPTVMN